ncbi:MAG: efflux transporter outer membrane subunit [Steroidobacteraceae bacterium]|jgi:NodT family efflux transporter outer membrane factor (OMF) lipoprotein
MKTSLTLWIQRVRPALQEVAPYAALALLPGGSLIALAAWVYRHRALAAARLKALRYVVLGVLAVAVAGCASTHGLQPAARLQTANTFATEDTFAAATLRKDNWPGRDWWTGLADPQLDQLIREGLRDSPSLKVAVARTRAALAEAGVSAAARLPQATLSADATRERLSDNGIFPPPFAGSTSTLSDLQASLSWEVDFWGKQRAAYQSALGLAQASAVDAEAARLALSTSIAHVYIQLQHAYLLLDVANSTLQQREQITALTRDRNAAGLDSRLEVRQTEEALPATREQMVQLQETVELTRHQLAALLGAGPDRGVAIARPAATAVSEPALPSRLPSDLLGRRPDLIAQRLRVAAAAQAIKVRQADFYPNVDLVAFVGFQRLGPGALVSAGERQLGVGPALSLPLFDAGRRRAQLAGADAAYDVAVEQYNQTLADALRDVADQLSSLRSVAAQRALQQQALGIARDAYDLAVLRYREGIGNYLQVLATEDQLLVQQRLDADLRARILDLSVALAGALGGGYEAPAGTVAYAP